MEITDGTAKFRVRKISGGVPTGTVEFFAGKTAPNGWLICNGQAVSRTTYKELFDAIGTTYGNGDGSSTFNLPNLIDKFAEGGTGVGTKREAGLPNITGVIRSTQTYGNNGIKLPYNPIISPIHAPVINGALSLIYDTFSSWSMTHDTSSPKKDVAGIDFNASKSNSIYGHSNTVQPPSLILLPIIKY